MVVPDIVKELLRSDLLDFSALKLSLSAPLKSSNYLLHYISSSLIRYESNMIVGDKISIGWSLKW
jgi:hypothetical protein